MNIARLFMFYSRRHWGRNLRQMSTGIPSYMALLIIFNFFLGFRNFYHFVSTNLGTGAITIDTTTGSIVKDPSLSAFLPGTVVIDFGNLWMLTASYNAFVTFAVIVTALLIWRELASANHASSLEVESRRPFFISIYRRSGSRAICYRLMIFQKLVMTGLALAIVIPLTQWVILPLVYGMIDQRIAIFFTFQPSNSLLMYLPVIGTALTGSLFVVFAGRRMMTEAFN